MLMNNNCVRTAHIKQPNALQATSNGSVGHRLLIRTFSYTEVD